MKKIILMLTLIASAPMVFANTTLDLIADGNAFYFYKCASGNLEIEIGGDLHGAVLETKVKTQAGILKYELLKNNDLKVTLFNKTEASIIIPKTHFKNTIQTRIGHIDIECKTSFYTQKDL